MIDIPSGERFINAEPIEKGWLVDKKYYVTETNGKKYLLRITPIERYENRKALFGMLDQVAALDIPMCLPIEFGTCDDGVYSIQKMLREGFGTLQGRQSTLREGFGASENPRQCFGKISERHNAANQPCWKFSFLPKAPSNVVGKFLNAI